MTENTICKRQPEMVNVGRIQMYCEHFTLSMENKLHEATNLNGFNVLTGKCSQSKRITFVGRVYIDKENDQFLMARILANLSSNETFEAFYRGMRFHKCVLKDFKVEDKGDDFIYLSLTVATSEMIDNIPRSTV